MRPTAVHSRENIRQKIWFFVLLLGLALPFAASLARARAEAQSYTWQNVRIVGGGYVDGIIAHPGQQDLFYARTDVGGAYRYNASTSSWLPLLDWTAPSNSTQAGVDSIAIDPNNTQMLYMTVGEYLDTKPANGADKGVTWKVSATGLTVWGNPATVPGGQGEIWLATWGGLYHSTDSGWNWSRLGNVNSAMAVGTGKAAPGASGKTIYLSGNVNGIAGIFRSTNGGSNWTQINDAAHQWGGSRVIVGDERTFGTVYLGNEGGRGIIYGTSPN